MEIVLRGNLVPISSPLPCYLQGGHNTALNSTWDLSVEEASAPLPSEALSGESLPGNLCYHGMRVVE